MFSNIYKNKKILLTGHTGFKGSWLTLWLLKLGANIVGVSKDIPTSPSMFEVLNIADKINSYVCDIRDLESFSKIVMSEKPDIIFHLAAQPIVSVSYADPIETITCNVIGTMNMMQILSKIDWPCISILVTSDKSYNNIESIWGYKENDAIGGKDIYSGSKGAAELIIKSYYHSFFENKNHSVKIAVGRAGNVIGGGDWAQDRIIVDTVRAWANKTAVEIRSPNSTRPWQHVLEPLSGYLLLGVKLYNDDQINGEAFNFGPKPEQNNSVVDLISIMRSYWANSLEFNSYIITDDKPFNEAGLLKLNCDKALFFLNWDATLKYHETVKFTGEWYSNYYLKNIDMVDFTNQQIEKYEIKAKNRRLVWAK